MALIFSGNFMWANTLTVITNNNIRNNLMKAYILPIILSWKNEVKKMHDLGIDSYFSASKRSISMQFSTTCLPTFSVWTKQKSFAI